LRRNYVKYAVLFVAALVLALGVVVASTPAHAATTLASLACPSNTFVKSDGTNLTYNGSVLKLRGYTFYPADDGGTAAWRSTAFQSYIDRDLTLGLSAGQNLIRPTDYWDKTNTQQTALDPTIWANMDHLVCQAQAKGAWVVMDLSAYGWLLESQGKNPWDATNWTSFLTTIGQHYRNAPSIADYSIMGEPAFPTTQAADNTLTAFYQSVTNTLYAADPNHLISAGGFNNMNNGLSGWWKPIFQLPHNDVDSYKTYSQHDLDNMPSYLAYSHSIHKPALDEEFGMPQSLGDATYSGQPYNGIATSRSQFYQNVYSEGEAGGAAGFVFWNLANLSGSSHYDVYPSVSPAVWAVMKAHGATVVVNPTPTPLPPTPTQVPPTNTPVPPTKTPAPTNTPSPTKTPAPTSTPNPCSVDPGK
jgi:hypothetical protein